MYSFDHQKFYEFNHTLCTEPSNKGSVEFSEEENAEINRSFSSLQVSPRNSNISLQNREEFNPIEMNFKKMLTKIGIVEVLLIQQPKNEKEYLPNIEVKMTKDNELLISDLIEKLKDLGFSLQGSMIFYYDFMAKLFVYCGNDPLKTNIFIIPYGKNKQIMIKYRKPQNFRIKPEEIEETTKIHPDYYMEEKKENLSFNNNKKRIKERFIGEVIEKVATWRKMHEGIEENGKKVQIPLDVAANRVGISKKTLDDYLFQIKLGKKYNFDFKEHENDKIGVLRSFVKKHRQMEKETKHEDDLTKYIQTSFEKINNQTNNTCIEHSRCPHCNCSPKCKDEADLLNYICTDDTQSKNFFFKEQETF